MQEDKLYHYAVIRLVPKVEREEFFNIGLILFRRKQSISDWPRIFVHTNTNSCNVKPIMRM